MAETGEGVWDEVSPLGDPWRMVRELDKERDFTDPEFGGIEIADGAEMRLALLEAGAWPLGDGRFLGVGAERLKAWDKAHCEFRLAGGRVPVTFHLPYGERRIEGTVEEMYVRDDALKAVVSLREAPASLDTRREAWEITVRLTPHLSTPKDKDLGEGVAAIVCRPAKGENLRRERPTKPDLDVPFGPSEARLRRLGVMAARACQGRGR